MKYNINRPKVPVIWLDTHAITQIARAVKFPDDNQENRYSRDLYIKLNRLARERKIIIFEADQMFEIGVRPELVEGSTSVLSALSLGLGTTKDIVDDAQHYLGMEAYLAGKEEAEIPWESAFIGDPYEDRLIDGVIIRVDLLSPEMIQKQKKLNESIAEQLEALRAKYVTDGVHERERRQKQTDAEFNAYAGIYERTLERYVTRGKESSLEGEFWQEYNIVLNPYANWKRLGGDADPRRLIDFYNSDFYKNLPHVDIWSRLTGQKMVIGSQIKRSDIADMHNIEFYMPYTNIMVLDRAMRGLVKDLKLDSKYDVNVIPLTGLEDLLPK